MKQLVAFDLDGTLADSKQPLQEAMGEALANLLDVADVAVIGAPHEEMGEEVVAVVQPRDFGDASPALAASISCCSIRTRTHATKSKFSSAQRMSPISSERLSIGIMSVVDFHSTITSP